MGAIKTKLTEENVLEFIDNCVNNEQKKKDSLELLAFMKACTGYAPKMWGTSIIGFGSYHYKSERSTQEGDWPLVSFSPRKTAISLYVYTGMKEHTYLLENLGQFKMGKACIYIKKLADIDKNVLRNLILETITFLETKWKNNTN